MSDCILAKLQSFYFPLRFRLNIAEQASTLMAIDIKDSSCSVETVSAALPNISESEEL